MRSPSHLCYLRLLRRWLVMVRSIQLGDRLIAYLSVSLVVMYWATWLHVSLVGYSHAL
jgi:hypothetical protein